MRQYLGQAECLKIVWWPKCNMFSGEKKLRLWHSVSWQVSTNIEIQCNLPSDVISNVVLYCGSSFAQRLIIIHAAVSCPLSRLSHIVHPFQLLENQMVWYGLVCCGMVGVQIWYSREIGLCPPRRGTHHPWVRPQPPNTQGWRKKPPRGEIITPGWWVAADARIGGIHPNKWLRLFPETANHLEFFMKN